MLQDNHDAIVRKIGLEFEVARIGIKDAKKPRSLPAQIFTCDLDAIIEDPAIDVVMELIGGIDPAERLVEKALECGKHVITANKELIAKQGSRLVLLAKHKGLDLHYEAAVGGGIPLVQPLKHQLAGNEVVRMMGILNGTTNYILTKMEKEGADFEDVLRDAQAKGYAEADPTNDVDGFDTSYKIAILASIAFGKQVPMEGVYREGIRSITKLDMQYAAQLGYGIKLLGIVEPAGQDRVLVRVHPTLIPKTHPLAAVDGVYNALWLHGNFVGDVMFSGRGAGSKATASAVIGDFVDVGRNIFAGGSGSAIPYGTGMLTAPITEVRCCFYLRIHVLDKPRVLGAIATEFGNYDVSLAAMEMKTLDGGRGEIVFLTHTCLEQSFRDSVTALETGGTIERVCNWFRVEDGE